MISETLLSIKDASSMKDAKFEISIIPEGMEELAADMAAIDYVPCECCRGDVKRFPGQVSWAKVYTTPEKDEVRGWYRLCAACHAQVCEHDDPGIYQLVRQTFPPDAPNADTICRNGYISVNL